MHETHDYLFQFLSAFLNGQDLIHCGGHLQGELHCRQNGFQFSMVFHCTEPLPEPLPEPVSAIPSQSEERTTATYRSAMRWFLTHGFSLTTATANGNEFGRTLRFCKDYPQACHKEKPRSQ
jgi:hypothetical protein